MIAIVGRGRVGRTLAAALRASGEPATLRKGRARSPRRFEGEPRLMLLSVPDGTIEATAERLRGRVPTTTPVLHCAGSRPVEDLRPLARDGHPVGVMHPLVSFPLIGKPNLAGTTFVLRGDPDALSAGTFVAARVGAHPVIGEMGPAYHAAAAMVANGAAALAWSGVAVLERIGLTRRQAARALGGLLRTVGDNVATVGVPEALSGPILRGDRETIHAHRAALDARERARYDRIAPVIIECAVEAGLDEVRANALRRDLTRGPRRR